MITTQSASLAYKSLSSPFLQVVFYISSILLGFYHVNLFDLSYISVILLMLVQLGAVWELTEIHDRNIDSKDVKIQVYAESVLFPLFIAGIFLVINFSVYFIFFLLSLFISGFSLDIGLSLGIYFVYLILGLFFIVSSSLHALG